MVNEVVDDQLRERCRLLRSPRVTARPRVVVEMSDLLAAPNVTKCDHLRIAVKT